MSNRVVIIRNAAPSDFGGGERFPVLVAEIVKNHGFEPIIYSASSKLHQFAESRHIISHPVPWLPVQNWSGWRIILTPLYLIWQLILWVWYTVLFTAKRPQAVHIQSRDDFIAATCAAKLVGARVVWTDHADLKHVWQNLSVWYKNPIGKLVYCAAKKADAITLVSESERTYVIQHLPGGSSVLDKLQVVYNGASDALQSTKSTKSKSFSVAVASRLVTDKGIGEAIEAFKRFHEKYPDSELRLIGSGPEEAKFRQQADGHSSIKFLGHQTEPFSYIKSADIFLQPTYHEGFSVGLVEACMLEMPIIATSVGGNVEIIKDRQTGLLVPAKDTDALLEAIETLYCDEKLRHTLAKNARLSYEQSFVFDDIVKKQFIPLYKGEVK